MARYVHPDGDDNAPGTAQEPWRSVYKATKGSNDGAAPNPARAAQSGEVVYVAPGTYDIVDAARNYWGSDGERRYMPLLNPVNSGVTFIGNGSLLVNRDDTLGQPMIGWCNVSVAWVGFEIDENRARATSDTGPVVAWGNGISRLEDISIRGLVDSQGNPWRGHPHNFGNNHNLLRVEGAQNSVFRNIRLRDSWQTEPHTNGAAVMLYGTRNCVFEDFTGDNLESFFFSKGTTDGTPSRYHNQHNALRRFRVTRCVKDVIICDSAWDFLIEDGDIDGSNDAAMLFKQTNNANAPKRVTVRRVRSRNCLSHVNFTGNWDGGFEDIRIEHEPGARILFESPNTGFCQLVESTAEPTPQPEPVPAPTPEPTPTPTPTPEPTFTMHRELDDALERALRNLGINANLSGGQFRVEGGTITMTPITVTLG